MTALTLPGADGSACDPAQPTATGPCAVRLTAYDVIDYLQAPTGAIPLAGATTTIDTCGRFVVTDATPPPFGFAALVVDDAPAATDARVPTVVALPTTSGVPAPPAPAYSLQRVSEQAWSTTAGLTTGFAARGAVMLTFRYHGQPVAGVQARRASNTIPDDDYYFSDATAARTAIAPAQAATGASGAALVINVATPQDYDGVGMAPPGCAWSHALAAAPAGSVMVQDKLAESSAGVACP
ncbi:MAG: hypothetical protein JNK64_39265 [Myxococcales bacterium]|nr:hypothetical protein [Myxococcales bacterium]